jgi:WD40 repeat protein
LSDSESSFDVRSLSFLENGKLAASYGDGTIRLWELSNKKEIGSFKAHNEAILTSSTLDWIYMASASNRDILIWNTQNGNLAKKLTGHSDFIYHLIRMQNGYLLSASADKTIKVWNSTNWSFVKTLNGHLDSVMCLAELSYDLLASGSEDGEIRIWNVKEGINLITWKAHSDAIKSLVLLPKQKYLASLAFGMEIQIWDFNQGVLIQTLMADEMLYSLAILSNGYLVSGSSYGYISIWDVESGLVKKTVFYDANTIWCMAVDLKGRLAVGMGNGDIRILNFLNLY